MDAWHAVSWFLFGRWVELSPFGLFGLVVFALVLRDWLGLNAWRLPWAAVVAWEWVVCLVAGHVPEPGHPWCARCGRHPKRKSA